MMEEWLHYEQAKLENERPLLQEQIHIITQGTKIDNEYALLPFLLKKQDNPTLLTVVQNVHKSLKTIQSV